MEEKKNCLKNRWFGQKNSKIPKKDGTKNRLRKKY
jgi:hypothetical protein